MGCRLVANAVDATFSKGDVIAIDMPMTVHAIIIYFAIILAGCVVVSIADSFAAKEIATRLHVSNAKGIFTQVKSHFYISLNLESPKDMNLILMISIACFNIEFRIDSCLQFECRILY